MKKNYVEAAFRDAEPITRDTPKHPVGSDPTFKIVGMRPRPKWEGQELGMAAQSILRKNYEADLLAWYRELEEHPHVQEVMKIPADEPIFVLRSQDIYAGETTDYWLSMAQKTVGTDKFSAAVQRYKEILEWQNQQPTRAKIPD